MKTENWKKPLLNEYYWILLCSYKVARLGGITNVRTKPAHHRYEQRWCFYLVVRVALTALSLRNRRSHFVPIDYAISKRPTTCYRFHLRTVKHLRTVSDLRTMVSCRQGLLSGSEHGWTVVRLRDLTLARSSNWCYLESPYSLGPFRATKLLRRVVFHGSCYCCQHQHHREISAVQEIGE